MGTQGAGRDVRGVQGVRGTGGVQGAAAPPAVEGGRETPGPRRAPGGRGLARVVACAAVVLCVSGLPAGWAPAAYANAGAAADGPAEGPADGTPDGSGADRKSTDPATGARTARLAEIHRRIEELYRTAEQATDAYNGAKEEVERQQKEIVALARTIDRTQRRLDTLTRQAGALASAQYRGGGVPAEARLLLNTDPAGFLDHATLARKAQHAAKRVIGQLGRTKGDLQGYARSATDRWERLEANRKKKDAARRDIEKKIEAAEKLESELAAEEKQRLRKLADQEAFRQQQKWLDSGVLKEIGNTASGAGKKAISYATAQLGKDYVWGAEGPDTFDCSGLTLRAWQAAGTTIPRTSQEQWKQLPHIPVAKMRPGDLIIYFDDASHVGVYVGDGAIVHAPRPGRQITVAGAGSMPILGVVRPDA